MGSGGRPSSHRRISLGLGVGLAAMGVLISCPLAGCVAPASRIHPEYGYTPARPIKVGGGAERGPGRELEYLDRLRGPRGEMVLYRRAGSCCPVEPSDGIAATVIGELHLYNVSHRGMVGYRTLYLDMYELEAFQAPVGFALAEETGN